MSTKSSLPFTSVVSLHTDPYTCGVARFSKQLAERLGVPFVGFSPSAPLGALPLYSLKWSEIRQANHPVAIREGFGVFWHDVGDPEVTSHAQHVFYADPSLGSPGLFCPSLIAPRKRPVRLFSFGMAHKLQTDKYKRVRELLDAASLPYHLRVSVGIHEGTSLSDATQHFDALKEIMGPEHVTILGILSDDAVSEELSNAHYVLSFFEKGLRANNTTVHAALAAGCRVVTNWDDATPTELRYITLDVSSVFQLPTLKTTYTWNNLIEAMRKECDKSQSQIA